MDIKNETLRRMLAGPFGWNVKKQNLLESNVTEGETQTDGRALAVVDKELSERAAQRLVASEVNKQKNMEDVIQRADEILQKEPSNELTSEESDQGWVEDCLDGAGKAYNDELKDYWAKLLAGEIKKPGSYSKRTVAFMKSLSQKDAERIRNMCQYVMYSEKNDASILQYDEEMYSFDEIRFLMELRLLDSQSFIVKKYKFDKGEGHMGFYHGDAGFIIKVKKPNYDLPVYTFTELGLEVLSIIDDMPTNIDNLKNFSEYMIKRKEPMEFLCGKLVLVDGIPAINMKEIIFELPEKVQSVETM
jgi:hypothetical protein